MKLHTLLRSAGYLADEGSEEISSIAFDVRAVTKNSLFVALCGKRFDGHNFLKEAAQKGAVCAITEREIADAPIKTVCVSDTRAALARLSDAFFGHPARKLRIVGVTGTNGKTTVTAILRAILKESGLRVGTVGTLGADADGTSLSSDHFDKEAHMTTPDPPVFYRLLSEMLCLGCDTVIIEATSHASVLKKLDPIVFDTLIFTNLTRDHLDFHGTLDAYFKAKATYFERTKRAVICLDGSERDGDPVQIAARASDCGASVCTFSEREAANADITVSDVHASLGTGTVLSLTDGNGEKTTFHSGLVGVKGEMNLASAVLAARMLGVNDTAIKRALRDFFGVCGRLERITPQGADFEVYVDFAHTADALEQLLLTVRSFHAGRICVLFGCGGDRDTLKRKDMAIVVSRYADFAYITSDNSRSEDPNVIIRDILRGMDKEKPYRVIPAREEAIERAIADALTGDLILLCGKGHERYQIDRDGIHTLCEADIVDAAWQRRMKH